MSEESDKGQSEEQEQGGHRTAIHELDGKAGKSKGFWSRLRADLKLPFFVSLFLAIPAFIFGIVAFWETHREDFDASSAYLNDQAPTKSGYAIHLTLANNGNPPVVIESAALDLHQADHNMPIFFYVADPRAIDGYLTDPTRVSAEKQALPIAVNPHSAQTVILLADPRTLNNGRTKRRIFRQEQQEFCDFAAPPDPEHVDAGSGIPSPTLILHVKWGSFVFGGPFEGAPDTELLKVDFRPGDKLRQPSWSARVNGSPVAPTSVLLRHHLAEPSVGGLAKMTMYSRSDPRPIYARERPLVGHTPTAFPLPPLDKSTYLVAFSVDGDVVLTSRLQVPTPKPGYNLAPTGRTGFCSPKAASYRQHFDALIYAGLR
jgi:hypothetical protein